WRQPRPSCAWSWPTWSARTSVSSRCSWRGGVWTLPDGTDPGADQVHEQRVQPVVVGQLGVEGGGDHPALTHRDDVLLTRVHDAGQDVDLGSHPLDPGSPDEDGPERHALDPGHPEVALEGVDLAPEGVAPHRHVQGAQALLVGPA